MERTGIMVHDDILSNTFQRFERTIHPPETRQDQVVVHTMLQCGERKEQSNPTPVAANDDDNKLTSLHIQQWPFHSLTPPLFVRSTFLGTRASLRIAPPASWTSPSSKRSTSSSSPLETRQRSQTMCSMYSTRTRTARSSSRSSLWLYQWPLVATWKTSCSVSAFFFFAVWVVHLATEETPQLPPKNDGINPPPKASTWTWME